MGGAGTPFGYALSKIPTSRAKNAREMGHPRFSSALVGQRPMDTQGRLCPLAESIEKASGQKCPLQTPALHTASPIRKGRKLGRLFLRLSPPAARLGISNDAA